MQNNSLKDSKDPKERRREEFEWETVEMTRWEDSKMIKASDFLQL
jgi:hypothetical protein